MAIISTDKPLRERAANEHYPTDLRLCIKALELLPDSIGEIYRDTPYFVDAGAGSGNWGLAAALRWPNACITGVEIDPLRDQPAFYDHWHTRSFVDIPAKDFAYVDAVIGNPPYGDPEDQEQRTAKRRAEKQFIGDKRAGLIPADKKFRFPKQPRNTTWADAEAFVRHGLEIVRPAGWVMYLLRLSFLGGRDRAEHLYKEHPARYVYTVSPRPSFTGDGNTDNEEYMLIIWEKGYSGKPELDQLVWKDEPMLKKRRPQKACAVQLALI